VPGKDLKTSKPRMRGVLHQVAVFVALIAAAVLVKAAPSSRAAWSAGIYGASLVTLLGISAAYHRCEWKPVARMRMRRLDHSAIFVLIAGSYTPFCLLGMPDPQGGEFLTWVWGGAAAGVVQSVLWPGAPRVLTAALCVALGSVVVTQWDALIHALPGSGIALLGAGGIAYIVGAICYSAQRPNPVPGVFGYHEVFHALVVVGAVLHFVAVAQVVLGPLGS
jgi:hemolysin III